MIAWLRSIFRSPCNEYPTIICLNWTKSNRNIEIDIQNFSLLALMVYIIKGDNLLIKLEKMNFICSDFFHLLRITIILFIDHTNSCLLIIISHSQLRIAIEAYVLLFIDSNLRTKLSTSHQIAPVSFSLFPLISKSIVIYTFGLGCSSLKQKFMNLYIAVIHYQVFRKVIFQSRPFNYIKLWITLHAINHVVNILLIGIPIFLEVLNHTLCIRKIFIKFFKIILIINMSKFILLCYLC